MARTKKVQIAGDSETMSLGRDGPSFTQVYDWVALSGVSPNAFRVYYDLVSHFNEGRGAAFPGKERLAVLLIVANGDSVTPYLRELEALGAIEIKKVGMPARNHYVVHKFPPPGYTGPLNKSEWSALHQSVLEFRNTAAKVKSNLARKRRHLYLNKKLPDTLPAWLLADYGNVMPTAEQWAEDHRLEVERRRGEETKRAEAKAKKADGAPRRQAKAQVSAVPCCGTEQVPCHSTEHVPCHSTGDVYLGDVDLGEVKKPPTPTVIVSGSAPSRVPAQNRGGDESSKPKNHKPPARPEVTALAAELHLLAAKPGWTVKANTAALATVLAAGQHAWPVIELVARQAAVDPGTDHPGRLARGWLPSEWWDSAYRRVAAARPSPRAAAITACVLCDPAGWIINVEPARRCDHSPVSVTA